MTSLDFEDEEPVPLARRRASTAAETRDPSSPRLEVREQSASWPSIEVRQEASSSPSIEVTEEDATFAIVALALADGAPSRSMDAGTAPSSDVPSHWADEGELLGGRYRLLDSVGNGGMGGVWSAFDEHLHRDVVLKMMSGALRADPEARRRFEQEAHALSLVTSSNIVRMFDHGVVGDSPYIVLERLHGEDLEKRLQRVGHLSLSETEVVLRQLANGIDAAHERKIVHRDIKPANIFLSLERDGAYQREVVKILDFGVAKLLHPRSARTRSGVTVGSPQFMSPEQVQGLRDLDTRSDLFALGAVVYTCITGNLPFAGEDLGETFLRICTASFTPPSEIWQSLPRGMDAFFRKAFAVDPQRRFTSATEMWSVFKTIVEARSDDDVSVDTAAPPAERNDSSLPIPPVTGRRRTARLMAVVVVATAAAAFAVMALADAFFGPAEDAAAQSAPSGSW